MKHDQQLPLEKTKVKIQVQYIKPIREESWLNIPKQFQKKSDGFTKTFSHTIWVETVDISNKEKLAFVIRKHFGFGRFNVLFYNRLCKSRFYNPNFTCLVQKGKLCKYKFKCSVWVRHKKGYQCYMNRKFRPNWDKRAGLTITPLDTFFDKDYTFKWHNHSDKMFYFSKWFWKGDRR